MQENLIPVLGQTIVTEQAIQERVAELAAQIARDYAGRPLHLLMVLRGAVPFLVDLARNLPLDVSFDSLAVTRSADSHVKLIKDLDIPIEGKDVLIVEDIVNGGNTLHYVLQTLYLRHPRSIKICTMFDRPQKRTTPVIIDYIGMKLDDRFVVGYGLDYNQRYRNLPDIRELNFVKNA
ncbi:hypoxanthine phosphoribosyltransferase [bacterium]|nr:hypoxanthine phosphoribosyltransferase [bacterium]